MNGNRGSPVLIRACPSDIGGGCTRNRPSDGHAGASTCRWLPCGCTTAAGPAMPCRRVHPWRERPPLRDAWYGIGEGGMCTPMPPSGEGRSRIRYPCRKAVQRRCGAADRQFYQPSSRCVRASPEDRARTRGERQTVGCRERRAMSRRFGSPETLGCGKAPIRESPARSLPRS